MAIGAINIKDLMRSGQSEVLLSESYEYDDLPMVGPAEADVRLELNTTGLVATGRFRATVEEPCDRCFEPYQRIIGGKLAERFVFESLTDASGRERELQAEDFYDTIGPDGVVDIHDLVRQYIVLGLATDRVCNGEGCQVPKDSA